MTERSLDDFLADLGDILDLPSILDDYLAYGYDSPESAVEGEIESAIYTIGVYKQILTEEYLKGSRISLEEATFLFSKMSEAEEAFITGDMTRAFFTVYELYFFISFLLEKYHSVP